jgi:hypothetical protein
MEVTVDIDTEDIVSEVMDGIDYSDIADTVMDKIDYDDIANEVASNHLDYSDIASSVHEYIDISDEAYNLLASYKPGNNCALGAEFTSVIEKALRYLIEVDSDVILKIKDYDPTVSNDDFNDGSEPVVVAQDNSETPVVETNTETPQAENGPTPMDKLQVIANLRDANITVVKRIVNDLIGQYVNDFNTDPMMRIRMEAKAFDILNEEFDKVVGNV